MTRLGCCFFGLDPEVLDTFTGTGSYYNYSPIFRNVVLTDGAKYVADHGGKHGAYWLMDAIASQIPLAAKDIPCAGTCNFGN